MFSSHYWGITLTFAGLAAVFAGFLASLRDGKKPKDLTDGFLAAFFAFCLSLVVERFCVYYGQPALYGSFFGYWKLIFPASIFALIFGCACGQSKKAVILALAWVFLLFAWPIAQSAYFGWGPQNAKALAHIPNVRVASPEEKIPPTDLDHMVRVSPLNALFKARQALTSNGDKKYSTHFEVGKMVLQSINKHRYYAAPLVPINSIDTFWTPIAGGRAESPGYVIVDAENKDAEAKVRGEYHITLFDNEGADCWNMSLSRFLYLNGYISGDLDEATFEVSDDFTPHYTATYLTPAFGNIVGQLVSKVLIVDFDDQGTPTVTEHKPMAAEIRWADRIMSKTLIRQYATLWGTYGQPYSNSGLWPWFHIATGLKKDDVMVPEEGEDGIMLSYTTGEQNVWVVPMTSLSSKDHAVIGVLVFETQENKATFYPGLSGFNHAGSAITTMHDIPSNKVNKYNVENLELYNIFGNLTWVGIYTNPQATGSTFVAIGLMKAGLTSTEVAYGTTLAEALEQYDRLLARGNDGEKATVLSNLKDFSGKIWRIGPIGNQAQWQFRLLDNEHFFEADLFSFKGMPLVRDGDQVKGKYLDTGGNVVVHVKELEPVAPSPAVTPNRD